MGEFEAFLPLVLLAVTIWALVSGDRKLHDPDNLTVVSTDQMREVCSLGEGRVAAVLVRQSGGEYRDLGSFDDAAAALKAVTSSFRRAKIDSVSISVNTQAEFIVKRLHHSHRGAAEGKKLGGAQLRLL